MSARAIRALRGDVDDPFKAAEDEESEDDDDGESEEFTSNAFATVMLEDDDDDDDSSKSSESSQKDNESIAGRAEELPSLRVATTTTKAATVAADAASVDEDDLEALILEFRQHDKTVDSCAELTPEATSKFALLLRGIETRDMDIDWSMRASLVEESRRPPNSNISRANGQERRGFLFGPTRTGPHPPKLIGGGLGMKRCADLAANDNTQSVIPWPYSDDTRLSWLTFVASDLYLQDCKDYSIIQQSGDFNALMWFVVHHPFNCPALLQLSSVLYQTNHSQEGLALLLRCLWIYESSSLPTFARQQFSNSVGLMDAAQEVNHTFIQAMTRLIQICDKSGLPQSAMAICRFILSLDPLRDLNNVLLKLDHYCLATNSSVNDQWLVDLVDSGIVQVYYRPDDSAETVACGLPGLPNWSFSYALALFRLSQCSVSDDNTTRLRADLALRDAVSRFPFVIARILAANGVDVTGRSFRRDWATVLNYDLMRHQTQSLDTASLPTVLESTEVITRFFVNHCAGMWSGDDVLDFVHDNLSALFEDTDTSELPPPPPSLALNRYLHVSLTDHDAADLQLPQDANIVDPGLLAEAMQINPTRGRMLRRRNQENAEEDGNHAREARVLHRPHLFGPPAQELDADLPLLELFWRR